MGGSEGGEGFDDNFDVDDNDTDDPDIDEYGRDGTRELGNDA